MVAKVLVWGSVLWAFTWLGTKSNQDTSPAGPVIAQNSKVTSAEPPISAACKPWLGIWPAIKLAFVRIQRSGLTCIDLNIKLQLLAQTPIFR